MVDDEHTLCGVISEKHVSRLLCRDQSGFAAQALPAVLEQNAADLREKPAIPVGRIMSARTGCPLGELIRIIRAKNANRLPVPDQSGALQGIVSRSDSIQAHGVLSCRASF